MFLVNLVSSSAVENVGNSFGVTHILHSGPQIVLYL